MIVKFALESESNSRVYISPDKIRFTSSKNDQTATLTLTFYQLEHLMRINGLITKERFLKIIIFFKEDYKISTRDIRIVWANGRPVALETIFLITLETEVIKLKKIFIDLAKS